MKAVEEKLWCNSIFLNPNCPVSVCCCVVSVFCVCTKRGRGLPPPIVTHHPMSDMQRSRSEVRVKTEAWPLACIMLTRGWVWPGSGHCVTGTPETRPGVRQQPASWSCWQPGGDNMHSAEQLSGKFRGQYFPMIVLVWQHYNIVTVSQNGRQRLLMALLHY